MKNNLDFSDIIKKASDLAHEKKSSIDIQLEKAGVDKVLQQVNQTVKNFSKEFETDDKKDINEEASPNKANAKRDYTSTAKAKDKKKEGQYKFLIKKIPSASIGGILFAVFGSIGMLLWGLIAAGALVLSNIFKLTNTVGFFSTGMIIISMIMLMIGIQNIAMHKRWKRYCQRIGDSSFSEIDLLMTDVDKSKKVVIRDLKKMHSCGYILDIYFDKKKETVILDHETFRQYEDSIKRQIVRANSLKAEVLREEALQEANEREDNENSGEVREVKEILEKGQLQLLEIKSFNSLLEKSVIFDKVEQFYKITNVIFGVIKKTPNKMKDIRKVHEYYLPSVIKMLNIYVKLNVQVEETQNIKESKLQIEGAIDTLNKAFEELLNSLFEDEALDIHSDITVLNMILAQEGLIGNDDFKINQ